jgi:hypothetical protein
MLSRSMPSTLPPIAQRLFDEVFPLLTRRDFGAIDVAVDAIAAAEIPEVWDYWLDGLHSRDPKSKTICPRRFSQAIPDRAFALHATLRLVATAPAACKAAQALRDTTLLKLDFGYHGAKVQTFDLSLLAGLVDLQSVQLSALHLVVPDSPRPDWLPRLTSLHVVNPMGRPAFSGDTTSEPFTKTLLHEQLCRTLPHVRDVQVR